jgi:hypothetical protein
VVLWKSAEARFDAFARGVTRLELGTRRRALSGSDALFTSHKAKIQGNTNSGSASQFIGIRTDFAKPRFA